VAGFSLLEVGTLEAGSKLDDRIELVELIGRGAMGAVYKAHQQGMDRAVAVKTLHLSSLSDMEQVTRFFREAKVVSTLDHPNIVKVFAFGLADERQPYMVMDYVDGSTLADLIVSNQINAADYLNIFIQVASALDHAHRRDIVHRDIKPRNILIQRDHEGKYVVKLVDFGIARFALPDTVPAQKLTKTGAIIGSPTYMSPEQCTGRVVDLRTDLYSLGCVMYEAATGDVPFRDENAVGLIGKHVMEPAPAIEGKTRIEGLPKSIGKIISLLLNKDPEDRYKNANDLCRDLTAIRDGVDPPFAAKASKSPTKTETPAQNKSKAVVTTMVIVTTVAISFFFVARGYGIHVERSPEPTHATATDIDRLYTKASHLAMTRRYVDALPMFTAAYDMCRESGMTNDKMFADICAGRAECENASNYLGNAGTYYSKALNYYNINESSNRRKIAELSMQWGKCELRQGHYATAVGLLRDAWTLYDKEVSMNLEGKTSLLESYTRALVGSGKMFSALVLYPKLIAMEENAGILGNTRAETHQRFALALEALGKKTDAEHQRALAEKCMAEQKKAEDRILN
jgi:serine/threonine protein kinase